MLAEVVDAAKDRLLPLALQADLLSERRHALHPVIGLFDHVAVAASLIGHTLARFDLRLSEQIGRPGRLSLLTGL